MALLPPLTSGKFRALNTGGEPLAGGKVFTYEPGGTTPKDSYQDAGAGTPNANPVILNNSGEADIFLDGAYRIVVKDASDNVQTDTDNVQLQPDPVTPVDLPYPGFVNAVINGGCLVSHRAAKSLTTGFLYAAVDLLAVKAGGTVGAGTIEQVTSAFTLTGTGGACWVKNATLTGSGMIYFRHRIESRDARLFVNQAANFSARAYQDTGSTQNYVITLRTANGVDDFSSVTDIDTDTVTLANDTNGGIEFSVADMGDCSNGIEIEVKITCGAVTTKNFYLGELQLSIGAEKKDFEFRPFAVEERLVERFLRPCAGILGVANSTSNMQALLSHQDMRATPAYEQTGALDMTDGYLADYSQSGPNVSIQDNTKDSGRVDIGSFSGLTPSRFHIQRGTANIILASAEL